jgi:hypothetical protein
MLTISNFISHSSLFNIANRVNAVLSTPLSTPLTELFYRVVRNPIFIGGVCVIGGGLGYYYYWNARKNVQIKSSNEEAILPLLPPAERTMSAELAPKIDKLISSLHTMQRAIFSYAAEVPGSMEEHSLKFYGYCVAQAEQELRDCPKNDEKALADRLSRCKTPFYVLKCYYQCYDPQNNCIAEPADVLEKYQPSLLNVLTDENLTTAKMMECLQKICIEVKLEGENQESKAQWAMYQLALDAYKTQGASDSTPNIANLLVSAMTLFNKTPDDWTYRQKLFALGAIHAYPLVAEVGKEIIDIYRQIAAENPSLSKILD